MNQFGTLYRYELKKIVKRKLVWITFAICLLLAALASSTDLTGKYYVDGQAVDTHYHMFLVDREYARALSGRKIDQELLEETAAAYGKIPPAAGRYTLTEEYQTYARPYSAIFNIVRAWTNNSVSAVTDWELEENALYAARRDSLETGWGLALLSEGEKAYWREKESLIAIPMTYYYYDGYHVLLNSFPPLGLMTLLFVTIALSGVFPEEHARRTDQLMLSCAKGKSTVYFSKICAGATVAALFSLLIAMITAGLTLGIYGTDGFRTALQIHHDYSYPLTFGQACILAYGILVITAVFMGVLVMVLSELLHGSIATLGTFTGFIILGGTFHIPAQYRTLSLIWSALPTAFLNLQGIFSIRLFPLAGHYFPLWQAVPVIYILCGLLAVAVGKRFFVRYQVSGR